MTPQTDIQLDGATYVNTVTTSIAYRALSNFAWLGHQCYAKVPRQTIELRVGLTTAEMHQDVLCAHSRGFLMHAENART